MAQPIRIGILGAGWPGAAHARGYAEAGGFKVVAVSDLIPARRKKLMADSGAPREFADANDLIADKDVDAVSICLPNHLHARLTLAALKAGKHVVCEKPPALDAKEARKIEAAAGKSGKVVLYAFQRRFGGAEQAARQAIEKGYAGEIYHARASWMRTRGIPIGTGWFTDKSKSGGGALIDIGIHMLDIAWHLMGQPKPISVFGITHARFATPAPSPSTLGEGRAQARGEGTKFDVEDAAFALIKFENGKSLELSTSWAINQPPQQQGTLCRLFGDKAAVDVYTPNGAVLHRKFDAKGQATATTLKPPKVTGHTALMRHFKQCLAAQSKPMVGAAQGVLLMQLIDAIYKSASSGKSVEVR